MAMLVMLLILLTDAEDPALGLPPGKIAADSGMPPFIRRPMGDPFRGILGMLIGPDT